MVEQADMHFIRAIHAFAAGDSIAAAELAAEAVRLNPSSRVYAAGNIYLHRVARQGTSNVYVSGEAFGAFIRGGGNLGLYQAASAALSEIYREYTALRLLDIGVGDGLALLPALTPNVTSLQLVEPSAAMLERTRASLADRGVAADAFVGTVQEYLTREADTRHWEVAQATWSLQSIPRPERLNVLRELRHHADRLLIAEFDAPEACDDPLSDACLRHVLASYEAGLAEYEGDDGLVAQGFLMPVLFGLFDRDTARTNYEQPIERWAEDLRGAGFGEVRVRELFPYWWAPAYLLDAR